jgi:hypothetical protein
MCLTKDHIGTCRSIIIVFTVLLIQFCWVANGWSQGTTATFELPVRWQYSAPLISPESRSSEPSYAQKDPTVVFHEGAWHLFMTVKLPDRSAIEYVSFKQWSQAGQAKRVLLPICESKYFCAPQVFYFEPHKKWYLVYQAEMPGVNKMWVAYSTTKNISDPSSWTKAKPMLDGGDDDPRVKGGLDYWIICDQQNAYLFLTSLNGKMWRLKTKLEDFPHGFGDCKIALTGNFLEASHTYRIKDQNKFITLVEASGKRYFQAYQAERLDGKWEPLKVTPNSAFASWKNITPAKGVSKWTDNVSHGEIVRFSNDQTLTIDPENLRFVFQGVLESEKENDKKKLNYGKIPWRIGILDSAN